MAQVGESLSRDFDRHLANNNHDGRILTCLLTRTGAPLAAPRAGRRREASNWIHKWLRSHANRALNSSEPIEHWPLMSSGRPAPQQSAKASVLGTSAEGRLLIRKSHRGGCCCL